MVEFSIVALPLLVVGLGSIELAHWFYTRQAITVALLDAGRAAITRHNHSEPVITAFEYALRPLYVAPTDHATTQRLERALANRQQRMAAAPWQIEFLSPSASAFTELSDPSLHVAGTSGQAAINNDYLAEQDVRYRARGWVDGRGPVSGQTVYEANTAVLRLSWLHEPRLPLLTPILKALGNPQGSYRQRGLALGYLPMARQITLMMQSHPVQWADSPDGKVIYGPENRSTAPPCTGWLCGTSLPEPPHHPTPAPGLDDVFVPVPPDAADAPPSGGTSNPGADNPHDHTHPDLAVDVNDPACGITLCCV